MKIYCNTYNWIKKTDIELNGNYNRTFETYLNENLFEYLFDYPPNKNNQLTYDEYYDIMVNNKKKIKIVYLPWKYDLCRFRKQFNENNQPIKGIIHNQQVYVWKKEWNSLVHKDLKNETNFMLVYN
jgi:hypothetical protein